MTNIQMGSNPDGFDVQAVLRQVNAHAPGADVDFIHDHPLRGHRTLRRFRLGNGLNVLVVCDPATPVVSYHSWFNVGSCHEKPGRTGMAHLFEHLMFKATTHHPEGEYDRVMEERGAQTNAATWVDWTCYHVTFPAQSDNLETVVRYESDRMVHLDLTSTQLESERDVVCNERRYRVDDDPDGKIAEVLYALALEGHPYAWPTIGWMDDIEAIGLEDCEAFYRTYYAPNNATVVVTGNVETEQVLSLIASYYGSIPAQVIPPPPDPAELAPLAAPRRRELVLPIRTERLLLGFVTPGLTHPDIPALDVAMELLFGGESSRVYQDLVMEKELASNTHGWVGHFRLSALTEIAVTLRPGRQAEEAEEAIHAALEDIGRKPPTARELEKARAQIEVATIRSVITANGLAGKLGHCEITAGDFRYLFTLLDAIDKVSADDVSRVVRQYFSPRACVGIVARAAPVAVEVGP